MNLEPIKPLSAALILFSAFIFSACAARTENAASNNEISNAPAANANVENVSSEIAAESAGGQISPAPDALVKDLYKTHGEDFKNNDDRILNGKSRKFLDKYFAKTLADPIWKDLTTNKGEIGVLDFDPFYNAQDADIKNLVVREPKIEGERATVTVTFQNFDRRETLNYQLVKQQNDWKIADIKYADGSTLAGYFKEAAKNDSKTESGAENFFAGTYKVGDTTCTVKPIKMAFEVKWAKGTGTMIFYFDGEPSQNRYVYTSEPTDKGGTDKFVFDDDTFTTGTFVRADGKEFPVSKIK
jgi:hypothetical protein